MTTLANFSVTDDVTDVLAAQYNMLLGSILRAEMYNPVTMGGTVDLLDGDVAIQRLDCNGANRIVKLPAQAAANHPFLLINATAATYLLQVQTSAGVFVTTLQPGYEAALLIPDGTTGWKLITPTGVGTTHSVRVAIEGLKLIRNSATSLSVGTGSCFAPNGNFINITGTLTAAGLALGASAWYHVYVYLNAGVPAMEVVTTAPAAWKGTAYGKTGDTSRRYVGSVKTDGAGNIYGFNHNVEAGYVAYLENTGGAPFGVLGGGAATAETSVSAAAVVPVTSKLMYAKFFAITQNLSLGNSEDNIVLSSGVAIVIVAAAKDAYVQFPLDASQAFTYLMAAAGGAGYAQVIGYYFDR